MPPTFFDRTRQKYVVPDASGPTGRDVVDDDAQYLLAPEEDPEPPRHCLEDMDLVAPVE